MFNKMIHVIVFAILFVVIVVYRHFVGQPNMSSLAFFGLLGLIQILLSVASWRMLYGSLIGPYPVWLGGMYIFCFGQSLLYPFDFDLSNSYNLLTMVYPYFITYDNIFAAQYITLIFLNATHMGAILALSPPTVATVNPKMVKYSPQGIDRGLKIIGWLLFVFSAVPFLLRNWQIFFIVQSSGYGGIYDQEILVGTSNLLSIVSSYFMVSMICLFAGYRNNARMRFCFFAFCFGYVLFCLYTGGRTNAVLLLAVLVLLYHFLIRDLRVKEIMILAVCGVLLLLMLSYVAEIRMMENRHFSDLFSFEVFRGGISNNIVSALCEMGGSMFPLIAVQNLQEAGLSLMNGESFLYSLTTVVPNIGFWELHPAQVHASLGDWLQAQLGVGYGPGFSIVAESFVNFGFCGVLFMFVYGFCLVKFFSRIGRPDQKRILMIVVCCIFCYLCIPTIRNSFISIVRSVFYYILPLYWGTLLLAAQYDKKHTVRDGQRSENHV